ncbi:hypothetical protein CONPUDRAFT_73718 [Coniophora puteana RWD-64-598 SS2]|uniref:DUF6533 domain-containing protein n=1 Tax=Coniophora puteana (strain RWD-64-598) TaxID=741705 RepID=A0A5M3MNL3_CONPW|nr:uncharacterized protein CONPUDRAFT_73718 [Coniophora puteana RWD-64-598 SS2]EIW80637.1 hypothetical protein CONPUDRAFT_73718 [Coniophora puteana RWD-64-598 SS2]
MDQLVDLATGFRTSNVRVRFQAPYVQYAETFMYVYDYILNIPDEIDYLWKGGTLGPGKILYSLAHYVPFVTIPLALIFHLVPGLDIHGAGVTFCEWLFWFRACIMWNYHRVVVFVCVAHGLHSYLCFWYRRF